MSTVLRTKTVKHGKSTFIFELVSFDSGWDGFSDKWAMSESGLIVGERGTTWDCNWYTVGKDLTVEQAQQEFDRDVNAFYVGLSVKVDYNNICTIYDELLTTSDYSYDDEQSTEELLECLFNNEVDMQYLQDKANEKRLEMLENLQQNS